MLKVSRDEWPPGVRRSATALLEHLKQNGQPIVVTVNDQIELEVQDEDSFGQLLGLIDRMEAIEGIRKGLEEMEGGKARPCEEVFREMQEKHGI